jgi:hypothetical protein
VRFEKRLRDGIAEGTITVTFRRWRRPQVVAGHWYRTGEGLVEMDAVDVIDERDITDADVRAAGHSSREALLADVAQAVAPDAVLYRLQFHRIDTPDPRSVLAAADDLDEAALASIDGRLDRLDKASSHGPWTAVVLGLIATHPAVRAPDLAASLGREVLDFKRDVRKLKQLGLTYSLRIGYQLSPRGEAYLRATKRPS